MRLGEAQPGLDLGAHLLGVDGLGDEIIGALGDAVADIALFQGRQEDEKGVFEVRVPFYGLADLRAIHVGHHPVADDQVRLGRAGLGQGLAAAVGGHHLVAVLLQELSQDSANKQGRHQ